MRMCCPSAFGLARAFHVLGVVLWIGGVAFVTTTLIPSLRKMLDSDKRLALCKLLAGMGQKSKPSHIPLPRPEQFEAFKAKVLQVIEVEIVHSDRVAFLELL